MSTEIAPTPWETRYDGHGGICLSDAAGRQIGFLSLRKEQEAHASLIAAAPDLLNAVRFLLSNPDNRISKADRDAAYAAITKATGGSA